MKTETRWLPILITDRGVGYIPFPMSEEDFSMMIATLKLWKRRLVPTLPVPHITGPFVPSLPLL